MAIKPKGKKVTGTNKADKITWINSKPWKVGLTVNGLGGNDVINFKKSKYKNKLNGGAGNDKIYGGKKNDTIHGNAGNDLLVSGNGNDKLYGDSGKNTIKGGAGNDSIYAGKGNDQIWGGAGNDYIDLTKGGNNKVYGEGGNDIIKFGLTDNYIDGGAGNDSIYGQGGFNTIKGGAGNDTIRAGMWFSNIDGGSDNDLIDARDANKSTLLGGAGDDIIYGGYFSDYVDGGAGNDKIYEYGNVDQYNAINGGAGNDTITVSSGNNAINGGDNDDEISIIGGVNVINAGAGNNKIHIHRPNDYTSFDNTVLKGGGTDTLFLENLESFEQYSAEYDGDDLKVFDGTGHVILSDFKNGHSVQYVSINGETRPLEVTLFGTDGADTISATTGAREILIGGDGADTYLFECGRWDTVFTSSDITHSTIVMGTDDAQDTINILTDKNSNGILLRKNGDNLVIWYKQQYYPDTDESDLDDGIYQIDGKDTYVHSGDRYFASITIKDYFVNDNPTVDRIVMGIPGSGEPNEYSIMSLYNNNVDLEYWSEGNYAGTYDEENRIYTGTKYNDYIYTQRGTDDDGDIVYGGAGNDTIYTWGRPDSAYGQDGDDVIYGNPRCKILDGGTGNDIISVSSSPYQPEGQYVTIFGGEGSDNITVERGSARIYTNSETGGKDTTKGVVDTITINTSTSARSKVYAQSETNIIVNNNDWENDDYFAYIDQTTFITESHGPDHNTLTVLDAAHSNLHIAFNMRNKSTGIEDDTLWILDDANYAKWQTNMNDETLVGVNIKGDDISKIERINASDGYYLGSDQLRQLESQVSNWLNSYNPSGYTYVSEILATEDKDTLITFIANSTNWQAPTT